MRIINVDDYWEQTTLKTKYFSSALNYPSGTYGQEWYADGGKPFNQLQAGDTIYVAKPINNRHRMAYYLAIEATKREIEKLYNSAASVRLGSLTLQDVFKMNASQLTSSRITYTNLYSKQ